MISFSGFIFGVYWGFSECYFCVVDTDDHIDF